MDSKQPHISVYILAHNRRDTIQLAIDSILAQKYANFTCIISDNSTNDDIKKLYYERYLNNPKVQILNRGGSYTGIEHINLVHEEVTDDYYMIFHDDDRMLPDMISSLISKMIEGKNVVAVGSNAFIEKNGTMTDRLFMRSKKDISFSNEVTLAKMFLKNTFPPFPSFLYAHKLIKDIRLDVSLGGKYSDSSFITRLAQNGSVIFCSQPLMIYSFHASQDSAHHDYKEYSSLLSFYNSIGVNKKELRRGRIYNLYNEYVRQFKEHGRPFTLHNSKFFLNHSFEFGIKYTIRYIAMRVGLNIG